jgi:hypothetical protein
MPSVLAQAAAETGDLRTAVNVLATDPKDRLARALVSLGRAMKARDSERQDVGRSGDLPPGEFREPHRKARGLR